MWPDDNHGLFDIPLRYRRQAVSTVIETGPVPSPTTYVYVKDAEQRVIKFTLDGVFVSQFTSGFSFGGVGAKPDSGLFIYQDEIYVTDYNNQLVKVFPIAASGSVSPTRQWSPYSGGTGTYFPDGIWVDNGTVYACYYGGTYQIQLTDVNGNPKGSTPQWYIRVGQPNAVSFYNNKVFVSSLYYVIAFLPNGTFQNYIGGGDITPRPPNFNGAYGTAPFDSNGLLYIPDSIGNYIHVYNSAGGYIFSWQQGSPLPSTMNPYSCAVYEDELFVTDQNNGAVVVFGLDGSYHRSWQGSDNPNGTLSYPNGIFVA